MEPLSLKSFKEELFQSRNVEQALLVALNAWTRLSTTRATIEDPSGVAFGAWFKRIQGQRTGSESALAAHCLSYLNLSESTFDMGDFYGANLEGSHIGSAFFACFMQANLKRTKFGDHFVNSMELRDHKGHSVFRNWLTYLMRTSDVTGLQQIPGERAIRLLRA